MQPDFDDADDRIYLDVFAFRSISFSESRISRQCTRQDIPFSKKHELPSKCNEYQDDADDDEENDNEDDDDDDISGKRAGTGQSRATFRVKRGSSTSPVVTMI